MSGTGGTTGAASGAITQGPDVASGSGTTSVTGVGAITEGPNVASGTGTATSIASGAITHGPDVVSGTGFTGITGPAVHPEIKYADALRKAQVNTIEPTVGPSPILRLCGGPIPSSVSAPDGGLSHVKMTLPQDWATTAAATPEISKLGNWDGRVTIGGTPTHFRMYAADGITPHIQGSVTSSGGGGTITLSHMTLVAGKKVRVNTFKITAGSGSASTPLAPNRLQFSSAIRNASMDRVQSFIGPSPILRLITGTPPESASGSDPGVTVATMVLPSTWLTALLGRGSI